MLFRYTARKSGKVPIYILRERNIRLSMSDKYIMALYTNCLMARKEAAMQGVQVDGFTEKEYGMVILENVGDVLFQALLLDSVRLNNAKMYAEFCVIYFLQ